MTPTDRVPSTVSSSSSVSSDGASLLGPSSVGLVSRASVSSEFSFYSDVDSPAGLPPSGPPNPVPRWGLAWEGPFLLELPHSGVGGLGRGCAFRRTTYRSSDCAKPSGNMGCRCTIPDFWNGLALRSRLDYWIKVLVLGCTRYPVNRPLTLPANFTGTCVS